MSEVKPARPMSPHLTVYRFSPTMAISILHRITGIANYAGTLLVVWWLLAAASGPDAYATVSDVFGSIIGRIVLFGFSWSLLHHMLGGLRYLIWDTGHALQKDTSTRLAVYNLVGSMVLTVLLWIISLAIG